MTSCFGLSRWARPAPPAPTKLDRVAGPHGPVGHKHIVFRDRARRIQDLDLKPVDREPLRITPQRHVAQPAVAMGEALLAALDPLDVLGEVDAGQVLLEGLMRGRLAGEQEVPALREHRLAHRLAGIEVVAKIHRIEPGQAGAVPSKPAPYGAALAVLLVVPVLRPDELRGER